MRREEQIEQQAYEFAFSTSSIRPELNADSFIQGAQWADQTMLDKVCEWLKENAYLYVSDFTGSLDEERLIIHLKQAMRL